MISERKDSDDGEIDAVEIARCTQCYAFGIRQSER